MTPWRRTSERLKLAPLGFLLLLVLGGVHEWYVHVQLKELQAQNIQRTALRWRLDDTERWLKEFDRRHTVWENDNNLTHLRIPTSSEATAGR